MDAVVFGGRAHSRVVTRFAVGVRSERTLVVWVVQFDLRVRERERGDRSPHEAEISPIKEISRLRVKRRLRANRAQQQAMHAAQIDSNVNTVRFAARLIGLPAGSNAVPP
jgi:hypothetical protein